MSLLLDKLFKDNPPNESIEKTIEKTILFLDTFSYGDEWDDLPKEYIKRKKLTKETVKHYYYARRLRYRLNNYLNKDTVIEEDTIPAGEYNLVEGWNDGPKVTVK